MAAYLGRFSAVERLTFLTLAFILLQRISLWLDCECTTITEAEKKTKKILTEKLQQVDMSLETTG